MPASLARVRAPGAAGGCRGSARRRRAARSRRAPAGPSCARIRPGAATVLTICTATAIPSPIAVPASGSRSAIDWRMASRSEVGTHERLGLGAERDQADLELAREPVEERPHRGDARRRAASARRRSARIEPETSTSSTIVAFWSGTDRRTRGRASAPAANDEREQEQRERDEPPQRRRRVGADLGEHLEVRERHRVPRAPAVTNEREHESTAESRAAPAGTSGEREGHPVAHLTPTCSDRLRRPAAAPRSPRSPARHGPRRSADATWTADASAGERAAARGAERGRVPGVDERLARSGTRASALALEAGGRASSVTARRSSGAPGRRSPWSRSCSVTEVGEGMQPMKRLERARRVVRRDGAEERVARSSYGRSATGLPRIAVEADADVLRVRLRVGAGDDASAPAGTGAGTSPRRSAARRPTGPRTRMHAGIPLHSSAPLRRDPAPRRRRATATRAARSAQRAVIRASGTRAPRAPRRRG